MLARCKRSQKRANSVLVSCPDALRIEAIEFSAGARVNDPAAMIAAFLKSKVLPDADVQRDGQAVLIDKREDEIRMFARMVMLPEGQHVVVLCSNDNDKKTVSRKRCEAAVDSLEKHGLPGGAFTYATTTPEIGGQNLVVPKDCKVEKGNRIRCPRQGLLWFLEVDQITDLQTLMKEFAEKHAKGYTVEDQARPCTAMGRPARCTVMTLEEDGKTRHKVISAVEHGNQHIVLSCVTTGTRSLTPRPCTQVLSIR